MDSSPGASHTPPAVVASTRLESLGLVREIRSDAVVERDTARALTQSPGWGSGNPAPYPHPTRTASRVYQPCFSNTARGLPTRGQALQLGGVLALRLDLQVLLRQHLDLVALLAVLAEHGGVEVVGRAVARVGLDG